ncbi:MAG: hypothetical protein AAGI38_19510 [Bacteroidota bacterium]
MEDYSRKRHGCVTAWLIFLIIANAALALIYLFLNEEFLDIYPDSDEFLITGLILMGILNVGCAVALLYWKKWGFYGFIIGNFLTVFINLGIGLDIGSSLSGLIAIGVLYGVLQIKQDGVSAWMLMD